MKLLILEFLQYTRIRSIFRNSGVSEADLTAAANAGFEFQNEKEFRLAKKLLKFTDVVLAVLADLHLHYLCDYLFELSSVYTEFYDNCYCVERDKESGAIRKVHLHRLILCELTAKVMAQCFNILGIKTLEKM